MSGLFGPLGSLSTFMDRQFSISLYKVHPKSCSPGSHDLGHDGASIFSVQTSKQASAEHDRDPIVTVTIKFKLNPHILLKTPHLSRLKLNSECPKLWHYDEEYGSCRPGIEHVDLQCSGDLIEVNFNNIIFNDENNITVNR